MMLSRWVSFGQVIVRLAMHNYLTPADDPTSHAVLDKSDKKYKSIVDRAASFAEEGVRFEVCRNDAAALGFKPKDLYGFITVIPAGPYALTYWQNKGYAYIAVGATVPTPPVTRFNKEEINKK